MTLIEQLLKVADLYCVATETGRGTLSETILGKGSQLQRLADGKADITTRVLARAMRWLSDHWPAETDWPEDVDRPVSSSDDAGEAVAAADPFVTPNSPSVSEAAHG